LNALLEVAAGKRVPSVPDDLVPLAAAEGMIGLVARACERVPRALQVQAMAVEARAARMVAELARIAAAFETAGVPMLVLKGPVLAQQLYGHPGARASSDVDLIVDPAGAEAGEEVLRGLGYRETVPLTPAQRRTNRRFAGESLFFHDATGILADFHWRFSHNQFPLRLPFADAWRRRQTLVVDGHPFATLGDTDLAVFTCSHAAKHLWHRLELLAQIAALARRPLDWPAVDALAASAGAARQTALSFLLARDLLGITPPPLASLLPGEKLLGRVRPIVDRNLFAPLESRRLDATGRDLFLLLDRRRDVFRSFALALFVPTHSDWAGGRGEGRNWVLRPLRLLMRRAKGKGQRGG
jgi:hypothetical protein